MNNPWIWLIIILADIIVLGVIVFFVTRAMNDRFRRELQGRADNALNQAVEKARLTEIEARDKALKILQDAEAENVRRRTELSREEERMQKRRAEIDSRSDRLEQKEQVLNKRQGALDKRANDVEKMASAQNEELQRVAQMTTDVVNTRRALGIA